MGVGLLGLFELVRDKGTEHAHVVFVEREYVGPFDRARRCRFGRLFVDANTAGGQTGHRLSVPLRIQHIDMLGRTVSLYTGGRQGASPDGQLQGASHLGYWVSVFRGQ